MEWNEDKWNRQMGNWLFHKFEPTKVELTIIREKPELIHFPFIAKNFPSDKNILFVRVEEYDYTLANSGAKVIKEYIEDTYYIDNLYELLNKWDIYFDDKNSRWVMV